MDHGTPHFDHPAPPPPSSPLLCRAAARRRPQATAQACIRPLDLSLFGLVDLPDTDALVHCYLQAGSFSTAFDDAGVHPEAHTDRAISCQPLPGVDEAALRRAEHLQLATGAWDGADYGFDEHNCCHYVQAVMRQAGVAEGIEDLFPGYSLPPDLPLI